MSASHTSHVHTPRRLKPFPSASHAEQTTQGEGQGKKKKPARGTCDVAGTCRATTRRSRHAIQLCRTLHAQPARSHGSNNAVTKKSGRAASASVSPEPQSTAVNQSKPRTIANLTNVHGEPQVANSRPTRIARGDICRVSGGLALVVEDDGDCMSSSVGEVPVVHLKVHPY